MLYSTDILYIGHDYGTSRHRAEALWRLGYDVEILDPWLFLSKSKIIKSLLGKFVYEAGAFWMEPIIRRRIKTRLEGRRVKVVWSDQCTLIGPETAAILKCHSDYMVTYVIDDPFSVRDKNRFKLYRKALSQYDLVAVVREQNVAEAYMHGASRVLRILRSADEVSHRPYEMTSREKNRYSSDVAFVGTWMPERGPILERLIELDVPLIIYGDRWHKAPEWPTLKKVWRGPGLLENAYVKTIQASKVCLGLLSKGNRDLHTTRSAEIPYIGSLLCAERTSEHLAMYDEDTEAVFWSTPEECAQKCISLVADDSRRHTIARAGRKRCISSGYLNEPIMDGILRALFMQPYDIFNF